MRPAWRSGACGPPSSWTAGVEPRQPGEADYVRQVIRRRCQAVRPDAEAGFPVLLHGRRLAMANAGPGVDRSSIDLRGWTSVGALDDAVADPLGPAAAGDPKSRQPATTSEPSRPIVRAGRDRPPRAHPSLAHSEQSCQHILMPEIPRSVRRFVRPGRLCSRSSANKRRASRESAANAATLIRILESPLESARLSRNGMPARFRDLWSFWLRKNQHNPRSS
jgi:hypothetical protein